MTKEQQKAHKFIRTTMKRLKVKMGLGLWKIEVEYLSAIENELPNCATVAQCTPIWQYMTATVEINMKEFCLLTEEEQERVLIHELCHVLVAEMREEDQDRKHEERVVTTLTDAFIWMRGSHV